MLHFQVMIYSYHLNHKKKITIKKNNKNILVQTEKKTLQGKANNITFQPSLLSGLHLFGMDDQFYFRPLLCNLTFFYY